MNLPNPSDPIVLADGTKIDPSTGKRVHEARAQQVTEVPSNTQLQKRATNVQRMLDDLPDTPDRMNLLAIVLSYTHFGLPDRDIALALGLDKAQVSRIRDLSAYKQLEETVTSQIIERSREDVRAIIQQGAKRAAERMVEFVESDSAAVALSAAKDVLDRDGHRPSDVVEHRVKMEGGLTIRVVEANEKESLPVIDITPQVEID